MGSTIFTTPTLLDSVLTHEKHLELLGQIYTTEEYKILFDQLTLKCSPGGLSFFNQVGGYSDQNPKLCKGLRTVQNTLKEQAQAIQAAKV
eukprot:15348735-Ditylum_brightwellii.AAC.1